MKVLFALFALIALAFFARNVLLLMFSLENYNVHRKRLNQLRFNAKKEDADVSEIIDKVTKPVILHVLPKLKPRNLEQLDRDLRMAKWDKNFTAIQYRALNITLKVVGVVAGLLLYNVAMPLAIVWAGALIFGMDYLFKNSIQNRKTKLIADFPDFIRITEGYLSANVPFSQAVAESIKYVGDEWKPILQNFVIESDVKSIEEALEGLKREVDLFEVREFVALVRLTLERGGDARESFSAQADKVREMQLEIIALKIGRRQLMGMAIQAPLLLANLITIALPTVSSMTSFTSM